MYWFIMLLRFFLRVLTGITEKDNSASGYTLSGCYGKTNASF